jgi:hypothetical protein
LSGEKKSLCTFVAPLHFLIAHERRPFAALADTFVVEVFPHAHSTLYVARQGRAVHETTVARPALQHLFSFVLTFVFLKT